MAIHTTGEWKYDQYFEIIADRYVAKVYDHSTTASSYKDANSVLKAEATANAALICDAVNNTVGSGIDPNAVPGILKELTNLVECWDNDTFQDIDIEEARKAIKSAELK